MSIARACYCNRFEAQRSVDWRDGVDIYAALDRAMQSAAQNIDAHMHRRFYPNDATLFFDWPSYEYAYPWRVWFSPRTEFDLTVMTSLTTGGVAITLDKVFLRPQNNAAEGKPWFTYFELDRSSSAALGGGSQTPQNAVVVAGTWGYGADADQVCTLGANVGSSDTTITVSDGSKCGAGDLIILGYGRGTAAFPSDTAGHAGAIAPYTGERVIVTDATWATTTTTISGTGCTTAVESDNQLVVAGGGALNAGEVIQVDAEHMLVLFATATGFAVRRGWDGTVLATHTTGTTIYGLRSLSVLRAQYGTAATTYTSGAAVYKHRVPSLIKDLAVAETVNQILQEGSGYARTVGGSDGAPIPAPGVSLAEKWDEARTAHGKKTRTGGI